MSIRPLWCDFVEADLRTVDDGVAVCGLRVEMETRRRGARSHHRTHREDRDESEPGGLEIASHRVPFVWRDRIDPLDERDGYRTLNSRSTPVNALSRSTVSKGGGLSFRLQMGCEDPVRALL